VNGGAEPRLTSGGEAATTQAPKPPRLRRRSRVVDPIRTQKHTRVINHPHPQTFICGIVVVSLNAENKKYVSARNVAQQMFVEQTTKQCNRV
jgi:hypothetical protein